MWGDKDNNMWQPSSISVQQDSRSIFESGPAYMNENSISYDLNVRARRHGRFSVIDRMRGMESRSLDLDGEHVSLAESYADKYMDQRVMGGKYNVGLSDIYTDKALFAAHFGLDTDGFIDPSDPNSSLVGNAFVETPSYAKEGLMDSFASSNIDTDINRADGGRVYSNWSSTDYAQDKKEPSRNKESSSRDEDLIDNMSTAQQMEMMLSEWKDDSENDSKTNSKHSHTVKKNDNISMSDSMYTLTQSSQSASWAQGNFTSSKTASQVENSGQQVVQNRNSTGVSVSIDMVQEKEIADVSRSIVQEKEETETRAKKQKKKKEGILIKKETKKDASKHLFITKHNPKSDNFTTVSIECSKCVDKMSYKEIREEISQIEKAFANAKKDKEELKGVIVYNKETQKRLKELKRELIKRELFQD